MRLLGWIAAAERWLEELANTLSVPALTLGTGIALVDLLTGGDLLHALPILLLVWGVAQAVGIDAQLPGAASKAKAAMLERRWLAFAGYLLLAACVGYVVIIAALVFSFKEAYGLTTTDALASLGFDETSWLVQRSVFSVAIVAVAAFTRYHPAAEKPAAETPEGRAARQERELAEAAHKARKRAIQAAGLHQAGQALTGRINPLDEATSSATDGHDDGPAGAGLPLANTGTDGPDLAGQSKRRARISPLRGVPANVMTAPQLVAWLRDELGVSIRDDDATAFVRNLPGAAKLDRVRGAPWAASKAQVKARARQKWGAAPTGKVAGD